jgi:hypothetical protein
MDVEDLAMLEMVLGEDAPGSRTEFGTVSAHRGSLPRVLDRDATFAHPRKALSY